MPCAGATPGPRRTPSPRRTSPPAPSRRGSAGAAPRRCWSSRTSSDRPPSAARTDLLKHPAPQLRVYSDGRAISQSPSPRPNRPRNRHCTGRGAAQRGTRAVAGASKLSARRPALGAVRTPTLPFPGAAATASSTPSLHRRRDRSSGGGAPSARACSSGRWSTRRVARPAARTPSPQHPAAGTTASTTLEPDASRTVPEPHAKPVSTASIRSPLGDRRGGVHHPCGHRGAVSRIEHTGVRQHRDPPSRTPLDGAASRPVAQGWPDRR